MVAAIDTPKVDISPLVRFASTTKAAAAAQINSDDIAVRETAFTKALAATLLGSAITNADKSGKDQEHELRPQLDFLKYLDQGRLRNVANTLEVLKIETQTTNLATEATSKLVDELVSKLTEMAAKGDRSYRAEFEAGTIIGSSTPVSDILASSTPVGEMLASSNPVSENLASSTPINETLASSNPVSENLASSTPINETLASSNPVSETLASSNPVSEVLASTPPAPSNTTSEVLAATQPAPSVDTQSEVLAATQPAPSVDTQSEVLASTPPTPSVDTPSEVLVITQLTPVDVTNTKAAIPNTTLGRLLDLLTSLFRRK